jgi:hypothetical protein
MLAVAVAALSSHAILSIVLHHEMLAVAVAASSQYVGPRVCLHHGMLATSFYYQYSLIQGSFYLYCYKRKNS